jgi:hypothetical protein
VVVGGGVSRDPSFIVAGAPRSGTTWLYHLLGRHPDVYMAKPARPEPKFFLVDEIYARGIDYYRETWFADTEGRQAVGEKTTNYMESAVAADRIRRHLPGVRLIFILREPAERAYSNWAWSRMNGIETEDFETALALEDQRERELPAALRYARPHAYFSRGLYADMLQPWFDSFPREQILCLKFDDLILRPGELARRLHGFIGVEERPRDVVGLDVINPSEKPTDMPSDRVRLPLQARYAEPNRRLAALLGPDFDRWEML